MLFSAILLNKSLQIDMDNRKENSEDNFFRQNLLRNSTFLPLVKAKNQDFEIPKTKRNLNVIFFFFEKTSNFFSENRKKRFKRTYFNKKSNYYPFYIFFLVFTPKTRFFFLSKWTKFGAFKCLMVHIFCWLLEIYINEVLIKKA